MNIDKILSKERQYNYLDRVEGSLSSKGLTFSDLKNTFVAVQVPMAYQQKCWLTSLVKTFNFQSIKQHVYVDTEL